MPIFSFFNKQIYVLSASNASMRALVRAVLVLSLAIPCYAHAFLQQEGKHTLTLGLGYASLYNDFEDHGESGITPNLGYYYGRENKFFPIVDFHFFKQEFRQSYFSSKSINFSIGYNYFSFDSFYFSPFGGLGFYLPRASRTINGVLEETDSKLVFGVSLGMDTFLKLNEDYGVGFRYQYHNPFDSPQDVGGDLEGHYTILSVNISKSF